MHSEEGGRVGRPDFPWRPPGQGQRDTTTVPEGFRDPDRFGRMRPKINPYAGRIENNPILPGRSTPGANIGGGWNLYEGAPSPRNYMMPMRQQYMDQMGSYGGGVGNQFARNAGANGMLREMLMASGPGDDDYGPFIPRSTLEADTLDDFIWWGDEWTPYPYDDDDFVGLG